VLSKTVFFLYFSTVAGELKAEPQNHAKQHA